MLALGLLAGCGLLVGCRGGSGDAARSQAQRETADCKAGVAELDALWGPTQAEELRRRFAETGRPWAAASADLGVAALDAWAQAWRDAQARACDRGDDKQARLDCLKDRRLRLAARASVLETGGTASVDWAELVVADLPDLAVCEGASPIPVDATLAPGLERAASQLTIGDLGGAEATLAELAVPLQAADPVVDPALRAEAALVRARLSSERGDPAALGQFQQAVDAALGVDDPALRVDAWLGLAHELVRYEPGSERAARLLVQVDAVAATATPTPTQAQERTRLQAVIARSLGKLPAARAALETIGQPQSLQPLAGATLALAWSELDLAAGDVEQARAVLDDALARLTEIHAGQDGEPPLHPMALRLRLARAQVLVGAGRDLEAAAADLAAVETSLAKTQDPQTPVRVRAGMTRAQLSLLRGQAAEALAQAQATRRICEAAPKQAALACLWTLVTVGEAATAAGDHSLAADSFATAITEAEALLGSEAATVGVIGGHRGASSFALGKLEDAKLELANAARILDATGVGGEQFAPVLADQGEVLIALGENEQAVLVLERARVIAPDDPTLRAAIEWGLARADADDEKPEEQAKAEAYARAALERYRGLGPAWGERVGEIEAWLAAR